MGRSELRSPRDPALCTYAVQAPTPLANAAAYPDAAGQDMNNGLRAPSEWLACARSTPGNCLRAALPSRGRVAPRNISGTCNRPASRSELINESVNQALSIKSRRKIMTMKHILAVALVAPFMTVSSMAQDAPRLDQHAYLGGPKSSIPHATRELTSVSGAFAMVPQAVTSHRYSGGPQTVVPHSK